MKTDERSVAVDTVVGSLSVRVSGEGPATVLWHSLFVDDRNWSRVDKQLAASRQVISVTGPGHGASGDSGERYDLDDCAQATATVLDQLEITGPVDWMGNAWGGHVGIVFASTWPARCRTLITIGSPVTALTAVERVRITALVVTYRLLGPLAFLRSAAAGALLSDDVRQRDPGAVAIIEDTLASADRRGMHNAMVSIMLGRPDLGPRLAKIRAPTLMVVGSEDAMWPRARAEEACRLLRDGAVAVVPASAHLPPLENPQALLDVVAAFWDGQQRSRSQGE